LKISILIIEKLTYGNPAWIILKTSVDRFIAFEKSHES